MMLKELIVIFLTFFLKDAFGEKFFARRRTFSLSKTNFLLSTQNFLFDDDKIFLSAMIFLLDDKKFLF